jgi:hypothetical protein
MSAVRTYVTVTMPIDQCEAMDLRRRAPMHLPFDPVEGLLFELPEGFEVLITRVKYIADECYVATRLQLPSPARDVLIEHSSSLVAQMLGVTECVAQSEDWDWRPANMATDALSEALQSQVAELAPEPGDAILEVRCLQQLAVAHEQIELHATDEQAMPSDEALTTMHTSVWALNPALRQHTGHAARVLLTASAGAIWQAAYPNDCAKVSHRSHLMAFLELERVRAVSKLEDLERAEQQAAKRAVAADREVSKLEDQQTVVEGLTVTPSNPLQYLREMAAAAHRGDPITLPPMCEVLEDFERQYPEAAVALVEYALGDLDLDLEPDLDAALSQVDEFVGAQLGQMDDTPELPPVTREAVLAFAHQVVAVMRQSLTISISPRTELMVPPDTPRLLAAARAMYPEHGNTMTTALRGNYTPQQLVPAVESLETWLDQLAAVTVSHNPDDGITTIQGPVGVLMPEMADIKDAFENVAVEEVTGRQMSRDEISQLAGLSSPEDEPEYEQEPDGDDEPDHDEEAAAAGEVATAE